MKISKRRRKPRCKLEQRFEGAFSKDSWRSTENDSDQTRRMELHVEIGS
jgi:hypothetical protein